MFLFLIKNLDGVSLKHYGCSFLLATKRIAEIWLPVRAIQWAPNPEIICRLQTMRLPWKRVIPKHQNQSNLNENSEFVIRPTAFTKVLQPINNFLCSQHDSILFYLAPYCKRQKHQLKRLVPPRKSWCHGRNFKHPATVRTETISTQTASHQTLKMQSSRSDIISKKGKMYFIFSKMEL